MNKPIEPPPPADKLPVVDAVKGKYPRVPAFISVGSMGGAPVHFIHDPERADRTDEAFNDFSDY